MKKHSSDSVDDLFAFQSVHNLMQTYNYTLVIINKYKHKVMVIFLAEINILL